MNNFYEILDASSNLTLEEQESFVDILQKRIIEEKRKKLIYEIMESEKEFETGDLQISTIDEIMKEIQFEI